MGPKARKMLEESVFEKNVQHHDNLTKEQIELFRSLVSESEGSEPSQEYGNVLLTLGFLCPETLPDCIKEIQDKIQENEYFGSQMGAIGAIENG